MFVAIFNWGLQGEVYRLVEISCSQKKVEKKIDKNSEAVRCTFQRRQECQFWSNIHATCRWVGGHPTCEGVEHRHRLRRTQSWKRVEWPPDGSPEVGDWRSEWNPPVTCRKRAWSRWTLSRASAIHNYSWTSSRDSRLFQTEKNKKVEQSQNHCCFAI